MEIIIDYFWVLLIVIMTVNGFIFKARTQKYIAEKPELESGYQDAFKVFLFCGNIPWVIMGIGNISGLTNNLFDFFFPREMNPIVLIWHASILTLYILAAIWIYLKGGAEFLEKHPGIIQKRGFSGEYKNVTAKQIKQFFPLILVGGISAMLMMWFMNLSAL
jgi:hypothetical protein